MEKRKE
jgi:hypothetical protein